MQSLTLNDDSDPNKAIRNDVLSTLDFLHSFHRADGRTRNHLPYQGLHLLHFDMGQVNPKPIPIPFHPKLSYTFPGLLIICL